MLIHITLVSMDIRAYCHFLPPSEKEETFFNLSHLIYLVVDHSPFQRQKYSLLRHALSGVGMKEDRENRKVDLLLVICQLQKYLGNGFLPKADEVDPDRKSVYYKWMKDNEDSILDSCRISEVKNGDKHWESMTEEEKNLKNPNLFSRIVTFLTERLGDSGIDFIRTSMSWNPTRRLTFGKKTSSPGKKANPFADSLDHQFLHF